MSLRPLERAAGAFRVIGGNHGLHAPNVLQASSTLTLAPASCPDSSPRGHGPVRDVHHQDLALVGDPSPGAVERHPASGHGLVVQEHGDAPPALTGALAAKAVVLIDPEQLVGKVAWPEGSPSR